MINDEENRILQSRIFRMAEQKNKNDTFVGGPDAKYQSAFMGGSHYGALRMKSTPDRYSGAGIEGAPVPVPESQLAYSEATLKGGSMNYISGSNGYAYGTNQDTGYESTMGFKGSGKPLKKMTQVQLERLGSIKPEEAVEKHVMIGSYLSGLGRPKGSKNRKTGAGEDQQDVTPPQVEPEGTAGYEKSLDIKNMYLQKSKKVQAIMDRYMKAKKSGASTIMASGKPDKLDRKVGGVLPIFSALTFLGKAFAGDILEGLLSPNKQEAIQKAITEAREEGRKAGLAEGIRAKTQESIGSEAKKVRTSQKIQEAPEEAERLHTEAQATEANDRAIKDLQEKAKLEVASKGAGKRKMLSKTEDLTLQGTGKIDGRKVRGQAIAKLMKDKKITFGDASKLYSSQKKGGVKVEKLGSKKGVKTVYEESSSSESESDVPPVQGAKLGTGKKRTLNPTMAKRMALVKKIMVSKKLSMIEASRFIKEHNIKY